MGLSHLLIIRFAAHYRARSLTLASGDPDFGVEPNTHLEIVEGLIDRLIELGKAFDFMAFPNRNHGIREGKGTAVHLRMHMIRYL